MARAGVGSAGVSPANTQAAGETPALQERRRAPVIGAPDMHLLPRRMRELAEVVGIPAFSVMVGEYGGGAALLVPAEANPDHPLWELIGADAFRALVARYKGDTIEVAKCDRAARELQRRMIRYEYFSVGRTQDSLAKQCRMTVRHIRNILYYIREPDAEEEKNYRLF